MIRQTRAIFCDNEHGCGDVRFPDFGYMDSSEIDAAFVSPRSTRQLRSDAKTEGWGVMKGHDYCPICMESEHPAKERAS